MVFFRFLLIPRRHPPNVTKHCSAVVASAPRNLRNFARNVPMDGNRALCCSTRRNKTSVVSIFGATDSRTYGYDSHLRSHIPANQDAPSKVFLSKAPCRNITCINKWGKSCRIIRCHMGRNPKEISHYIAAYFRSVKHEYSEAL